MSRRFLPVFLLFITCSAANAQPRGYQERACGFDLDDDGIVGEAGDCDICDGTTTDPDGDAVSEDLIYVDCDAGVDDGSCGAPGDACATIDHAFNTRADGNGDGAEDIVCFKGTCSPAAVIRPTIGGVEGSYTVAASGSQGRSFEFPSDPAMLVGWDADGDGSYPPFDTDDTAVLDGGANSLALAFQMNFAESSDNSYFEMAHFTAIDYGRYDGVPVGGVGGFLKPNSARADRSHLYIHDLSLQNINKDQQASSGRITFDVFAIQGHTHLAFVNIEALEIGGYFSRGSGANELPDAGPLRYQNLTITAHSCDASGPGVCPSPSSATVTGWKIWSYVSGFEILDSIFDGNTTEWISAGARGVVAAQCSRDWLIRNNEFIDATRALNVQGHASGFCDSPGRTLDDVVFDRNVFRNTDATWALVIPVQIAGGTTTTSTSEDVVISSNYFSSAAGWHSGISIIQGNDAGTQPGSVSIVHNTFASQPTGGGATTIRAEAFGKTYPQQNILIKNNIIAGLSSGHNMITDYEPSSWDCDYNVFDPDASYKWNGTQSTLAEWQSSSGDDASSDECAPAFVDAGSDNYHLAAGDTCALGAGVTGSGVTVDYDGDAYASPPSAGADEPASASLAGAAVSGGSCCGG